MNSARQHTDQSHHQGDTTVVLKGVVIRSDSIETAADLAASIYVIQNYGRPEGEQDVLPQGVTAEDVARAIARHRNQRAANRAAIDAHKETLSRPLPKRSQGVDVPPVEKPATEPFSIWPTLAAIAMAVLSIPWWVGICEIAMRIFGWEK